MGQIVHHAIIVTSCDDKAIEKAHDYAKEIGCAVTDIVDSGTNSYRSFLIAPDGSKSGWLSSQDGDDRRAAFVLWTAAQRHEDDSSPLEWCEIAYGSDDRAAKVERHEWQYAALPSPIDQ